MVIIFLPKDELGTFEVISRRAGNDVLDWNGNVDEPLFNYVRPSKCARFLMNLYEEKLILYSPSDMLRI